MLLPLMRITSVEAYPVAEDYIVFLAVESHNPRGDFLAVCCRFLPLCSHSKILRRTDPPIDENTIHRFQATLTVGLPPFFQETYISNVTVIPSKLTVETVSIESKLFDSLKSRWLISPVEVAAGADENNGTINRCHIDFEVEMTVSDPIIKNTLDQVLQQVAGRQVEAFAERCRQIPIVAPKDSPTIQRHDITHHHAIQDTRRQ